MFKLLQQCGIIWCNIIETLERYNRRAAFVIFYPLLIWCKRVGLTPLFFVSFRILSLPILFLLFQESLFWAGILLIILVVSDIVDGVLARYLDVVTDRGRFEDLFSDFLMYGVCLLGIISLQAAGTGLAAYSLFISPVISILAVLKKQEHHPTNWLIKPKPHIWYYKVIFYFSFFLYLFLAKNSLDEILWLMNSLMTIESLYYFGILQKRWRLEQ